MIKNTIISYVCRSTLGVGSSSAPSNMGGLSVTGCIADFSVYIFHPYGGKKSGKST